MAAADDEPLDERAASVGQQGSRGVQAVTSWRDSGTTHATASRPTMQTADATRRTLLATVLPIVASTSVWPGSLIGHLDDRPVRGQQPVLLPGPGHYQDRRALGNPQDTALILGRNPR